MAWGSNFPASEGGMADNLVLGKACLESVSKEDRAWIFSKTAQTLYRFWRLNVNKTGAAAAASPPPRTPLLALAPFWLLSRCGP